MDMSGIADNLSPVSSPAVTFVVSSERRFFVGHEHVIAQSPYFRSILREMSMVGAHANKVVELPDECATLTLNDPRIL